jgi:hypothetical protein
MTTRQAQASREMPEVEVVRIAELVNFQVGTVGSRTLRKRPAGMVTVFAFDEGRVSANTQLHSTHCFKCLKAAPKLLSAASRFRQGLATLILLRAVAVVAPGIAGVYWQQKATLNFSTWLAVPYIPALKGEVLRHHG